MCGHATLSTAHVLYQNNYVPSSETKSWILKTLKTGDCVQLDFPETPVSDVELPKGIENIIGAKIIYSGQKN